MGVIVESSARLVKAAARAKASTSPLGEAAKAR
jgi:hypothetical protein